MQSTLQALFRSTIAGVVVQGFRSSSVPVTKVIWSSHADLSGSGGFFYWTRFENLVAKRRKINDRVVPILVAIRN